MAWYLLAQRKEPGRGIWHCFSCSDIDAIGPFRECFVPQVEEALGACTNCLFVGRGDQCTLRRRGFGGLNRDMLAHASTEELARWWGWLQEERAERVLDAELAAGDETGAGHGTGA